MRKFYLLIITIIGIFMIASCSQRVCYKTKEGKAKMKYFNGIQYGHHLKKNNRN